MTDNSNAIKARIADLNVLMHCKTQFMVRRLDKYVYDFDGAADVEIDISLEQLEQYCIKYPNMNTDMAEYMLSGSVFYVQLYRKYNGLMIHASAIAMDGEGYLFSANSGTGKSTHAEQWYKTFGARVQTVNDDKPAVRLMPTGWTVYGTPWSGKTELNENIGVPLRSIAILHRSKENKIASMAVTESITNLLEQTIRPKSKQGADVFFELLSQLIEKVPVYDLGCDISEEAARVAYETMKQ